MSLALVSPLWQENRDKGGRSHEKTRRLVEDFSERVRTTAERQKCRQNRNLDLVPTDSILITDSYGVEHKE